MRDLQPPAPHRTAPERPHPRAEARGRPDGGERFADTLAATPDRPEKRDRPERPDRPERQRAGAPDERAETRGSSPERARPCAEAAEKPAPEPTATRPASDVGEPETPVAASDAPFRPEAPAVRSALVAAILEQASGETAEAIGPENGEGEGADGLVAPEAAEAPVVTVPAAPAPPVAAAPVLPPARGEGAGAALPFAEAAPGAPTPDMAAAAEATGQSKPFPDGSEPRDGGRDPEGSRGPERAAAFAPVEPLPREAGVLPPGLDAVARAAQPPQGAVASAPASSPGPSPDPALQPVPIGSVPIEIGLKALGGTNRFEIRLSPEDLGRIDVSLEIREDGEVKARLVVERPETLALLQRDARSLERALDQAGLKAGDGAIDMQLRDSGGGRGEERGDGGRDGQGGRAAPPAPDRTQAPPPPPARTIWRGAAGIDVRI